MEVNEKNNEQMKKVAEPIIDDHSVSLSKIDIEDRGGIVWGIVGLLAPVIGLILHLIMRKNLPRNAKALKIGVIISLVLIVVFIIAYFGIITTMLFVAPEI